MLYADPFKALCEEASIDGFDSKEVKDTVEELNDAMENVPEPDTTELGVDIGEVKAEMAPLVEGASIYGRKTWLLEMNILGMVMEAEDTDDPGEAVEQIADANSGEEDEDGTPVEITKADVVVITPSEEEVKEIVADAVQEAKVSKGKKGPAQKKLEGLTDTVTKLKKDGIRMVKKPSKGKKKSCK